jgi:hypothetical protein
MFSIIFFYLVSESESTHRSRASSCDETYEDAFVDGLDAEAHLVVGVLAQDHLVKEKDNFDYSDSSYRLIIEK